MKTIEIVISPTGQCRVETKGFQGTACRDASRFLEQAIGTRVSEQPTAEFYAAERVTAQSANLTQGS